MRPNGGDPLRRVRCVGGIARAAGTQWNASLQKSIFEEGASPEITDAFSQSLSLFAILFNQLFDNK
jgi:hypothetical protein